jgi:hypothetical protein
MLLNEKLCTFNDCCFMYCINIDETKTSAIKYG